MTTRDDRAELDRLVDRYCDGVIRRDVEVWGSTWADDAVWDLGRGPVHGRDAIVDTWSNAMTAFDWVVQTAPLRMFEVDAEAVDGNGRVTTIEQFRRTDGSRGTLLATYHDSYVRSTVGWRFGERRLEIIDYRIEP